MSLWQWPVRRGREARRSRRQGARESNGDSPEEHDTVSESLPIPHAAVRATPRASVVRALPAPT